MTSSETCYVCLDKETDERKFVDPNPCSCKGTIKLHNDCALELTNNTSKCSVCKTKWRFTGVKNRFWRNGDIAEEFTYVDGKCILHKEYYESGELWKIIEDGHTKIYSKSSTLLRYSYSINDHYLNKEFYDTGELALEEYFNNHSMLTGYFKVYYINGQVSQEGHLKGGCFFGLQKYYYQNGKLKEEFYCTGENAEDKKGPFKRYNENGVLIEEGIN